MVREKIETKSTEGEKVRVFVDKQEIGYAKRIIWKTREKFFCRLEGINFNMNKLSVEPLYRPLFSFKLKTKYPGIFIFEMPWFYIVLAEAYPFFMFSTSKKLVFEDEESIF